MWVLGAAMRERDAFDIICGILTAESFYVEAHQRIFQVMMRISAKSQRIEELGVVQELRDTGFLDLVGGAYYVVKLTNDVVSTANLDAYCRKIQEKFILRELGRVTGEVYNESFNNPDAFDLLDMAEAKIMAIGEKVQQESADMSSVLMTAVQQIERWRSMDTAITGVPSGMKEFDSNTRGWQPGELIILAARPSVGKTAMSLKLAKGAAEAGFPVAYFSLEMSKEKLVLRMMAEQAEMNLHLIQTGKLSDNDMKELHRDGISQLSKLPIYWDDPAGLTLFELRAKCRRLKKKHNIGFIIIDYLQLMTGEGKIREQEISSLSRGLKKLSKELQVPIIALSQLSRDIEKRTGFKRIPQLSDLRESGAIEQDADMVVFLYGPSEEEIAQNPALAGRRLLKIAKARDGQLYTHEMDFKGEFQRFSDHVEPTIGYKPIAEVKTLF